MAHFLLTLASFLLAAAADSPQPVNLSMTYDKGGRATVVSYGNGTTNSGPPGQAAHRGQVLNMLNMGFDADVTGVITAGEGIFKPAGGGSRSIAASRGFFTPACGPQQGHSVDNVDDH